MLAASPSKIRELLARRARRWGPSARRPSAGRPSGPQWRWAEQDIRGTPCTSQSETPLRTALLTLLVTLPLAAHAGRKKKEPPPPPPDPLAPVELALFEPVAAEVDEDPEFWVPLAHYELGKKSAFVAVPVERIDDVLHTGPALVILSDDGRVQSTPYLSTMQVAGLLGGRDYTEHDRHVGVAEDAVGEAVRQSFEQYANGARAGSVYASTKAIQALGRVFSLDHFGHSATVPGLLERALANEVIVKADRDPSVAAEHILLVVGDDKQVWLLEETEPRSERWIVKKKR